MTDAAPIQHHPTNPYWDEITTHFAGRTSPYRKTWQPEWFPGLYTGDLDPSRSRDQLVDTYSWAITAPDAVAWVAKRAGSSIVEIGAGRGYWASLLTQHDVTVDAYDLHPPDKRGNQFHKKGTLYHPVQKGGPEKAALHPESTLFLCWPPYAEEMASAALRSYQGADLVYIGENGGCTADDSFFEQLTQEWELVDKCSDHIQWHGMRDEICHYQRQ